MRTKTEVPTLNEKKLTVMAGANGYQNSLLSAGYTETADALQGSTSILTLRPRCQGRTRCRGSSTARTAPPPRCIRHLRRHAAQPARALHVILGGPYSWYEVRSTGSSAQRGRRVHALCRHRVRCHAMGLGMTTRARPRLACARASKRRLSPDPTGLDRGVWAAIFGSPSTG